MFQLVKQLCSISLLCGAVFALTPEGNIKKIMQIVFTLALVSMVIVPLSDFSLEQYSLEITSYKEREKEFLNKSKELEKNLNRQVIEQKCEEYIMDKAKELGLRIDEIKVNTHWDSGGFWMPDNVEINHGYSMALSEYIETELGVPTELQQWNDDEN